MRRPSMRRGRISAMPGGWSNGVPDSRFATLTIALGLGANAAIFSLVTACCSSGLSRARAHRAAVGTPPAGLRNGISAANYIDWTKQSQSFEAMAAQTGAAMSYAASGGGASPSVRVTVVSAPYFDVFGTRAALGRTFTSDEDQPGRDKVTVISHRLWLNLFGADATIVAAPSCEWRSVYRRRGAAGEQRVRSAVGRSVDSAGVSGAGGPNYHYLTAVARLKPGVSVEQAQAEMRAIAEGMPTRYPTSRRAGARPSIATSIAWSGRSSNCRWRC